VEAERSKPEKVGDAKDADAKPDRETKSEPGGSPELLIQRFDKDGDGKLNDAEWAEMRKGAGQTVRDRGDSRRPMNPPLGPMNPAVIQRFDRDGDGKLNDTEQAAAREAFARMPGRPGSGPPNFEEFAKRFDRDGDGKLSDEERTAAREAFARMPGRPGGGPPPNFEEFAKRFDRDGDGKLSDEERAAARGAFARMPGGPGGPFNPEEMIRRFDRDGDGKLNEAEQQAARAAFARGPGPGGPGAGGLLPGEGKGPDSKLDKEQLLKRFDKDGDGKLSDEERAAAREALSR
jgi:Ca2+-binding EF-hand superfamily protein